METSEKGIGNQTVQAADVFSDIILPSITALAGLLGLAGALTQLTANSRLRKQAEYWKAEFQGTDLAHDRAVFQSLHRRSIAKLIARDAIQLRRLADGFVGLLLGGLIAVVAGATVAHAQNLVGILLGSILLIFATFSMYISVGQYSVLNWHRRKVYEDFLDGKNMQSRHSMLPDKREQSTILGRRGRAEVRVLAIAMSLATAAVSYSVTGEFVLSQAVPVWASILASGATVTTLYLAYAIATTGEFKASDEWQHPRELTEEAAAPIAPLPECVDQQAS